MNTLKLKRNSPAYNNQAGPSKPLIASDYRKEFSSSEPGPDSRYLLDKFGGMGPAEWHARGGINIPSGAAYQHNATHTLGKDSKWSNTDFFTGIFISGLDPKAPPKFGSQLYPLPALYEAAHGYRNYNTARGPQPTDSIQEELFHEIQRELLKDKLRKEMETSGLPIEPNVGSLSSNFQVLGNAINTPLPPSPPPSPQPNIDPRAGPQQIPQRGYNRQNVFRQSQDNWSTETPPELLSRKRPGSFMPLTPPKTPRLY